jgi:hypothetical protein
MAEQRTNDAPAPAEDTAIANEAPAEVALLPAEDAALAPVAAAAPVPAPAPILSDALDPAVAAALGRDISLDPADVAAAEQAAAASEHAPAAVPPSAPAEPVSPAKEWGAAVALMIVFALMCASFLSYFRGC